MHKIYSIASLYTEEIRALEKKVEEALLNKESYALTEEDVHDDERPYQVYNGLALYSIKGKMLSSGNWFTRWLGIPTYDQIGNDLAQMSQDEEVEKVLISMSTPGGHVAGISDLSDTWKKLNAEKPITVHTAGNLASAGIWLSSNSSKIYASETAEVGSIGVILMHTSYQDNLEKAGIKVTEIKSAPLKHIGSPTRDLTKEEEEHLQTKVEESAGLFKKQIYQTRPLIQEEAFTGEMFSASEGLRIGLIDGISTYNELFQQLSAPADNEPINTSYKEFPMKKKVTQAMFDAAVSAGADPESLEIVSQEVYDGLSEEEKNVLTGEGEGEEAIEGDDDTGEGNASAGEGEEATEGDDEPSEVEALTAQVASLQAELTTANAQVESLTAKVSELEGLLKDANSEPLRVIAEERIGVMRTAMGLAKMDFSGFAVATLLNEYQSLDTQFKAMYVPGGIAKKNSVKSGDKPEATNVTSIDKARLKAVGL